MLGLQENLSLVRLESIKSFDSARERKRTRRFIVLQYQQMCQGLMVS